MRLFSVIDFTIDWWDGFSCLFVMFCFERVLIERMWIVLSDCLIWLIVPVGCFLLNGCDFVRKKKNKGLTVHCIVAFVKPYVKMSADWFKRLIFWFGRVLFVVKTFSCSERRFANNEKVNRLPNRRILFLRWRKRSGLFGLGLIARILWRKG